MKGLTVLVKYIIIAVILMLAGGTIFMFVKTSGIAKKVYTHLLVRNTPEKWQRVCSAPDNKEQMAMWDDGLAWAEKNASAKRDVMIENEGLKLFGELYDFGGESCVIILPGRCECLKYSYHYALPYQKAGINVLVIDARCHGESDGVYTTIGVAESRDAIAWAEYLHDRENMKKVFFHGVCLGGAASMFAAASEKLPPYVTAMVNEGCFVNFRESFKNHMIADNRPVFPVLDLIMFNIKKNTGVNVLRDCPLNAAKKATLPVLFIFGEKDIYSVPEKSRRLIATYAGENKRVKWLPNGGHSHLRINNTEEYDNAVIEFIKEF